MRRSVLLWLALGVASALAVVYVRHQHRVLFVALQAVEHERDRLNTEWGQLLLEQSTWSFHHLVEKKARERLEMVSPQPEDIVVVKTQ